MNSSEVYKRKISQYQQKKERHQEQVGVCLEGLDLAVREDTQQVTTRKLPWKGRGLDMNTIQRILQSQQKKNRGLVSEPDGK